MNPRLKTSKKWTSLPAELKAQISDIFSENFQNAAQIGRFFVDGRIYNNELLFRVGYLENGRLKQANFEVSIDYDSHKQNALALIHLAVDCAASLVNEFLEQEQDLSDFPITWVQFEVDPKLTGNSKIFVQTSTVNTELENEADRLLGLTDDKLVRINEDEEPSNEEIDTAISMLGLDPEEIKESAAKSSSNPKTKQKKKKSFGASPKKVSKRIKH